MIEPDVPHHIAHLDPAQHVRAALMRHAAVTMEGDAAVRRRSEVADDTPAAVTLDASIDRWAEAEAEALDALSAAMAAPGARVDVRAVLDHAAEQGERDGEPGAQTAVLLRLVAALAARQIPN